MARTNEYAHYRQEERQRLDDEAHRRDTGRENYNLRMETELRISPDEYRTECVRAHCRLKRAIARRLAVIHMRVARGRFEDAD